MIERGHDPVTLMRLDLPSFNELVEASDRNETRRKLELMYMNHVAAQGETKTVKEFTKDWEKQVGPPPKGAAEFLAIYGKGI